MLSGHFACLVLIGCILLLALMLASLNNSTHFNDYTTSHNAMTSFCAERHRAVGLLTVEGKGCSRGLLIVFLASERTICLAFDQYYTRPFCCEYYLEFIRTMCYPWLRTLTCTKCPSSVRVPRGSLCTLTPEI